MKKSILIVATLMYGVLMVGMNPYVTVAGTAGENKETYDNAIAHCKIFSTVQSEIDRCLSAAKFVFDRDEAIRIEQEAAQKKLDAEAEARVRAEMRVKAEMNASGATSCTNSGGTYNASGPGTCNCPSGTAVDDVCPSGGGGGGVSNGGGGNSNGGGGVTPASSERIINPLKSQSIQEFLLKIIDVLLVFALPLIILYIMYAGYLFVIAAGNSEKVTSAKNALLWSVIGGVIVLGARLIISVIQGTVTAF